MKDYRGTMIVDLCDNLLDLLGISESQPKFRQLRTDLGEPDKVVTVGALRDYMYFSLGLVITCRGEEDPKVFSQFTLKFFTQDISSGKVQPFQGRLVANIESGDSRDSVESKFGVKPSRRSHKNDEFADHYVIPPFDYGFMFGPAERLTMMTVAWTGSERSDGEIATTIH